MREIKFRAWDEIKKVMYHDNFEINSKGEIIRTFGLYPSPKVILMQYTGLKDKDGKEIYEGDEIRGKICRHDGLGIYEVCWDYNGYSVRRKPNPNWDWPERKDGYVYCELTVEDIEIIGNIYENPELLEEKPE